MNIGIIAHNSKKSLIEDFCIAYKGILMKHEVYATGTTGRRIEEVTNLHVHKFLPGSVGGPVQYPDCNKYRNCGVSDFGTCKRRFGLERAVESRLIHQTKTVRTKIRPT